MKLRSGIADCTRRRLLQGASSLAVGYGLAAPGLTYDSSRCFRFAVVADTHIIDQYYRGPESNEFDTRSLFHSAERLAIARDSINGITPPVKLTFVCGDYFHDYPSDDYDFYFRRKTRLDIAKEITDGFRMPVYQGFGNHDYCVPKMSRENSHRLFMAKFGRRPYYAVEHEGWRFMHLNSFLGTTWDPKSRDYDLNVGSLGEEQLNWFEVELRRRQPSVVFIHYPLLIVKDVEIQDYGILPLLKKYSDVIQLIIAGHLHKWYDFAHSFGPQHYVMASTRYDPNAYLCVQVDLKQPGCAITNLSSLDWATHYARRW